ncbi:MAG: SIR2 family protein [Fibrobacteraceae bacterium]|nr:SIR2 family protein [Fibrobacteraceae bacterium]
MDTSNFYDRVFVLGSGFSRSFCKALPTLKDINTLIPEGIPDEFPHFKEYCIRFLGLCNGQKEYLNIESLATSILSARIFPGERERLYHASLRFELLRFIASVIGRNHPMEQSSSVVLKRFLQSCTNCPKDGERHTLILSFNYDTLIEELIDNDSELKNLWTVDYGVRIEPADRSSFREVRNHTVDLIKLHGSLNWYPIKGCDHELDIKNVCLVEPRDRSFPIYREDTPIYIPMAHAKESFLKGSLFNLLWSKAEFYLKNAKEITFLGYGFPSSDVNNLEFLLRHGDRIKNVVVFENEGNPNLERLSRLFGEKLVSMDACVYLSK